MTPAQEAKEYAATHGFVISTLASIRKLRVYHVNHNGGRMGEHIAEVRGYPAALNAMKREMETLRKQATTRVSADHEFGTVQIPLRTGHISFDDMPTHMQQRVRELAASLRKPFAISIDGRLMLDRYATRQEAIREVRRLLSAPGATGAQYRASRISVECL